MSLGQSIRSSTKWLLAGNVGSQVLTFIFGVALARLLTPADFGLIVTIQIFTGLAGFFAGGGMGQALVRAKDVTKRDYDAVFTMQLAIGIFLYVLFYLAAPWIAASYGNPVYENLLRLSALNFIMRPFANLPGNLLQREMRFKEKALASIVGLLVTNCTSVTLAVLGHGVWSLVLGGLAGALSNAVVLSLTARWHPWFNFALSHTAELAKFGALVTFNNLFQHFRNYTANFLISLFQSPGFLGLFNKADSLRQIPIQLVSGSVYQVSFRALAIAQDNKAEARRLFQRALMLVSLYTLPIYVMLWFVADPFISFVYGEKWLASASPLKILSLTGFFMVVANQSGAVLEAFNRLPAELRLQAGLWVMEIAMLVSVLMLAPSLDNVAWGVLAIAIYSSARMLFLAAKTLELGWRGCAAAVMPPLVCSLVLAMLGGLIDYFLSDLRQTAPYLYIALIVPLLGAAYFGFALAFPFQDVRIEAQRWVTGMKEFGGFGKKKL